jgi:hypothetical protein
MSGEQGSQTTGQANDQGAHEAGGTTAAIKAEKVEAPKAINADAGENGANAAEGTTGREIKPSNVAKDEASAPIESSIQPKKTGGASESTGQWSAPGSEDEKRIVEFLETLAGRKASEKADGEKTKLDEVLSDGKFHYMGAPREAGKPKYHTSPKHPYEHYDFYETDSVATLDTSLDRDLSLMDPPRKEAKLPRASEVGKKIHIPREFEEPENGALD